MSAADLCWWSAIVNINMYAIYADIYGWVDDMAQSRPSRDSNFPVIQIASNVHSFHAKMIWHEPSSLNMNSHFRTHTHTYPHTRHLIHGVWCFIEVLYSIECCRFEINHLHIFAFPVTASLHHPWHLLQCNHSSKTSSLLFRQNVYRVSAIRSVVDDFALIRSLM